jgi:hypothetical protein
MELEEAAQTDESNAVAELAEDLKGVAVTQN